ncbi:hypothetical protein EAF04_008119 [Stromatinia cepivora]|nr:hypothetical protein EAF04_008119 [Stromatinia cepivora]
MQGTRRRHQKSRTGCMTCKQKKIKCDELKPACQYCTLRSIQCTYALPKSSSPNPNLGSRTPNGQITDSLRVSTPSVSSPFISTPSTSATPLALSPCHPAVGAQWSLSDLELLHFYTVSTSLTFSNVAARRHVWQYVVPQIAFSHDFLLHGLLALAALHLSRISPERKDSLWASALTHHAIALPMFRSAVESINSLNCHACSAFGVLVTVYEWAQTEHTSNLFFANAEHSTEASTIEWVQLLRGSARITYCYYEEIAKGPLGQVLRWDNTAELEAEANPAESAKFSALEQLWDSTRVPVTAAEVDSLQEALRWLKIIYTMMTTPSSNNDPASTALSWPVRVPEHYLLMVNERQPAALILLSHFCLLLNKVEDFWWIRGMSRRLLQEIHQTLGAEWEPRIAWPLQDLVLCEFKQQSSLKAIQT